MNEHNARLTISRPSYGNDDEFIEISITDDDARLTFAKVKISYADFAACLTGASEVHCSVAVNGLHNVGKLRETDSLRFKMPKGSGFWDKDAAAKEAKRICPEGWLVSAYFSSQDSFYDDNGESWAKTGLTRWVEKPGTT